MPVESRVRLTLLTVELAGRRAAERLAGSRQRLGNSARSTAGRSVWYPLPSLERRWKKNELIYYLNLITASLGLKYVVVYSKMNK